MKPIDEEGRSVKLDSLKELLSLLKKNGLSKLPKKGSVSVTEIAVSKPKKASPMLDEEMPESSEDSMEMPESSEDSMEMSDEESASDEQSMEMGDEEASQELSDEESDDYKEELSSGPEAGMSDAAPSEEEDEFMLPEPKIPSDIMDLVKLMLKNKGK